MFLKNLKIRKVEDYTIGRAILVMKDGNKLRSICVAGFSGCAEPGTESPPGTNKDPHSRRQFCREVKCFGPGL